MHRTIDYIINADNLAITDINIHKTNKLQLHSISNQKINIIRNRKNKILKLYAINICAKLICKS